MAPKTAQGKKRNRDEGASSSRAPPPPKPQEPTYNVSGIMPTWPRQEKTRMQAEFEPVKRGLTLKTVLTSDEVDQREVQAIWDEYDSLLYNEWLDVPISTTKFIDRLALLHLECADEVASLVKGMGLEKLVSVDHTMYPDLVRQFFATVRLSSTAKTEVEKLDPRRFFMSFMSNGKRYKMNARAVCSAFGFPEVPLVALPKDIEGGMTLFWSQIGTGAYKVGTSAQADVRHPVARYMLRLITTTLICKIEPVKVRSHELVLLSYALRSIIPNATWENRTPNMGLVLMEYLYSLRHTPLNLKNPGKKQLAVGSILTPIFERANVSMTEYEEKDTSAYVDLHHMQHARWITCDYPLHWIFSTSLNTKRMVEIKQVKELMRVTDDHSLIHFDPPEELLKQVELTKKLTTRGEGTSAAGTSQAPPGQTQQHQDDHLHTLPPYPSGEVSLEKKVDWGVGALKAIWDVLTCRSSCVQPRTRTPSPPRQPSTEHHSPEDDTSEFHSPEEEA